MEENNKFLLRGDKSILEIPLDGKNMDKLIQALYDLCLENKIDATLTRKNGQG